MPKLKKKKTEEVTKEVVQEETTTPAEQEEQKQENINEEEALALAKQVEEDENNTVHTDKLNKALKVVHDKFGLDGYSVMSFKDGGSKVDVSVTNGDFDLKITIRDCENEGIY